MDIFNLTKKQRTWLDQHGGRTIRDVKIDLENKLYIELLGRNRTCVIEYVPDDEKLPEIY